MFITPLTGIPARQQPRREEGRDGGQAKWGGASQGRRGGHKRAVNCNKITCISQSIQYLSIFLFKERCYNRKERRYKGNYRMSKKKIERRQEERGGTAFRRAMIAAGCIAAAAALIYLAGTFFFAGHYYWRTWIDGTDYSFRSKEQVREELLNPSVTYELQIKGREGMEDTMTPAELEMIYVFDDTLDRLNAEMTGLKWPTMLFYRNHYELPKMVTYSEKALKERLSDTVFFDKANINTPVNAYIGAYSPDKGYEIVEEYPGTVLDFDKVKAAVAAALEDMEDISGFNPGRLLQRCGG